MNGTDACFEVKRAPGKWAWDQGTQGWMLWLGDKQIAWFASRRAAEFCKAGGRHCSAVNAAVLMVDEFMSQTQTLTFQAAGTEFHEPRAEDIIRAAVLSEREACAAHLDACAKAAEDNIIVVTAKGLRHIAATIRARE